MTGPPSRRPPVSAPPGTDSSYLQLAKRFDVALKEIQIGSETFRLLKVHDTNKLLDMIDAETFSQDERLPYWGDVWSSSIELARWCLQEGDMVEKRVLEIGCGVGLAGIAAAAAGAAVTLSDYEQDALDFACYNVANNLPETALVSRVRFLHLDWRHLPSLEPFDMIIGSDVVYERSSFPALIDVLRTLMKPEGFAILAEPGRTIGTDFFMRVEREGFRVSVEERSVMWEGRNSIVRRAGIRRGDECVHE